MPSSTQGRPKRPRRLFFANFERIHHLESAVLVMTMSYVMICNSKDLGDPPPYKANDISCYHEVSDSLPVMNETALKGTSKNIFLIETSCKGYLDLRQACAVESAARAHPDWQVNLLFVGPVTRERLTTGILSSLQSYKNVVIARVYFSEIVKDTPLERLLSEKLLDKSEHRFAHTSDIIRLLLLWKFVGVYMDLDIVVIKPFDDLGLDFAGLEESTVRTGVMGLSNSFVGRKIASTAVLLCAETYDPSSFSSCGSKLVNELSCHLCRAKTITTAANCKGFKVHSEETFYPISTQHWQEYFQRKDFDASKFINSYTAHIYNSFSHNVKVKHWTLYGSMAKIFCPSVFKKIYNSEILHKC